MTAHNFHNLIGQRFGRLLVVARAPDGAGGVTRWSCLCDCGCAAVVGRQYLRNGMTKSCGCLRSELTAAKMTKHGHKRRGRITPEYYSYMSMIARCERPQEKDRQYYKDKGITVCARWRHGENGLTGFACFYADMGLRPAGMTLDRWPNPDGNYEKENCRWATPIQQRHNRA